MNWLQDRSRAHVETSLLALLRPLDRKLRRGAVRVVSEGIVHEQRQDFDQADLLVPSLFRIIERTLAELERLDSESTALLVAYQNALDETERRELLRRHLRATSTNGMEARRDLSAVERWLDLEAVRERYAMRMSQRTDEVAICYDCIAALVARLETGATAALTLRRSGLIAPMLEHASPQIRTPIRCAALNALNEVVRQLEPSERAMALGASGIRRLTDYASGTKVTRWVQIRALDVVAVALRPAALRALLKEILTQSRLDDGMVVRAGAVRQFGALDMTVALSLARLCLKDPSEHVRQVLARTMLTLRDQRAVRLLYHLALKDASPRVRGVAQRILVERAIVDSRAIPWTVSSLIRSLDASCPPLVVRVALKQLLRLLELRHDVEAGQFIHRLSELANSPAVSAELAEAAAAALRTLALDADGEALMRRLRGLLSELDEGQRVKVRLNQPLATILSALRVAARHDHAVALRPLGGGVYQLTRGEPRCLRLWRLWHELRNPMPDKRKGHVHTHARAPLGPYVIPPLRMAEVTPTRVPGERVLHERLGGWAPFVPRIDDLLTAALRRQALRLVTTCGTIVVEGPSGLSSRLRAWLWLTLNYPKASLVRESSLEATEPRGQQAFAALARSLGFRFSRDVDDCHVTVANASCRLDAPWFERYLGALGVVLGIPPDLLQQFFVHALSATANTPSQLAIVIWVILVGYVLRSTVIMHQIVRARNGVPLRIGGWGTRGKSGSERLKAALFHALRYDVVVKTTGCEAMFIHAQRDQPAQEIFIYRPYDKATIWEQRNMLDVAARLKTQVFLWECMALQPKFVETLISEWMQDPITTLTNAYPDHEDIQGPSGEDVARVIGRFMPHHGTTFTTEEQMLPLLSDAARRKATQLIKVDPLDADLLPKDLLDRLPYQEHPRNVALVLALAEHFEIDREYALVEIADHVVLDLGVLKTYPEASHRGRRLVFSNGMSANERAGFMSNWVRLGYDRHDVDRDADSVTVAVVNNRADRVARSRVFAQIIVDDASLSSVVLINSNLGGMMSFITEALDRKLPTLSILGDGPSERILERFSEHLRWLKVSMHERSTERMLEKSLPLLDLTDTAIQAYLAQPDISSAIAAGRPDALITHLEATLPQVEDAAKSAIRADIIQHASRIAGRRHRAAMCQRAIEQAIAANQMAKVDALFREAYRELFLDRITVLWNTGASGDQVIDFVTNAVPPGHLGRILGCQNIKGTGLDFVYRWLSIDRVSIALEKLESTPALRQELLAWLGSYNDFGLLDARQALGALEQIRQRGGVEWGTLDHMVAGVITRLSQLVAEKQARLHTVGKADLFSKVAGAVEAAVDHLDSARRSRKASLVMRDLFAARVGHGRAALLLREITGRQKGGWLAKDLKHWLSKQVSKRSS